MAVTLVNCASLKKFPAEYLYEVDMDNKVCGEYKVVDSERLLFEHVRDLPINSCNGVFGFSDKKIGPVLNWGRDAIIYVREHCK
jgi:hypothetical protein